ncbi:cytochrome C oxidase subunit IV family protein [Crocinitomicaceae bacterium]|nr:cytochrome C oxidase subunit IV family protein [Crocinitomicaceae bacterium]MDC0257810.1 cytochrome C oxidase subunit IV family protein [Crocinitomicaceae bacterium]
MIRDDVIEYSLDAHHDEEAGRKIRKKIWMVTGLLTAITAAEVLLGALIKQGDTWSWFITKWTFVILTLLKAGYIVLTFMHLGDERKGMRYVILVPYILFILYLMFICLWEGKEVGAAWPATYAG